MAKGKHLSEQNWGKINLRRENLHWISVKFLKALHHLVLLIPISRKKDKKLRLLKGGIISNFKKGNK